MANYCFQVIMRFSSYVHKPSDILVMRFLELFLVIFVVNLGYKLPPTLPISKSDS